VTGRDDEFDDFLARRRKLFRAPEQDVLEPPEEVDRIVLRQAREAIEIRNSPREIRGLGWGAPLALAATLLVAFSVILNVGRPRKEPVPEVTVEHVAQRLDYPAAPAASKTESTTDRAAPVPAPALVSDHSEAPATATARSAARQAGTNASSSPEWRHDPQSWLAEIQRLRAAGKNTEADAELAEYKRQHRVWAGSTDR
jgi:hypothetical protein